jgi:hypothetical protein
VIDKSKWITYAQLMTGSFGKSKIIGLTAHQPTERELLLSNKKLHLRKVRKIRRS